MLVEKVAVRRGCAMVAVLRFVERCTQSVPALPMRFHIPTRATPSKFQNSPQTEIVIALPNRTCSNACVAASSLNPALASACLALCSIFSLLSTCVCCHSTTHNTQHTTHLVLHLLYNLYEHMCSIATQSYALNECLQCLRCRCIVRQCQQRQLVAK